MTWNTEVVVPPEDFIALVQYELQDQSTVSHTVSFSFRLWQGLVRMPKPLHHPEDGAGADEISTLLWENYKIEVRMNLTRAQTREPVVIYLLIGESQAMIFPLPGLGLVVRIAAQIYLTKDDFTHFANAVLDLMEKSLY